MLPANLSVDRATTTASDALARCHMVHRLPVLMLHVHSDCNCRCVMCDIWKTRAHREIPLEGAREIDDGDVIAHEIGIVHDSGRSELGVERVVLTGGEPLMHSQFPELLRLVRDGGFSTTVLSTGLLVRRHADALARDCDEYRQPGARA